jgi:hypothetical protein
LLLVQSYQLQEGFMTTPLGGQPDRSTVASPPPSSWFARLVGERSVRITAALWLAANVVVLLLAGDALPFDWPDTPGSAVDHVLNTNLGLVWIFGLMGVTLLLTRRRTAPDLAARAPDRATALRETVLLLAYGALGLVAGYLLARLFGWHPFGLHLAGSIFGTHSHVEPAEAIAWASYNLVV